MFSVSPTDCGRIAVTIDGETVTASPAFWRMVIHSLAVRDAIQDVTRVMKLIELIVEDMPGE